MTLVYDGMDTVLGLIGMLVFIAAVIALSAAVTYSVVRLTPKKKPPEPVEADS